MDLIFGYFVAIFGLLGYFIELQRHIDKPIPILSNVSSPWDISYFDGSDDAKLYLLFVKIGAILSIHCILNFNLCLCHKVATNIVKLITSGAKIETLT